MPGETESAGPSYISAHSADVILSEVRPIKLKSDALRSINVLLDEFLYNILNTAGSIHTDKLRASLLSLLPTTLGKEALLEAEVELRAYWERTGPADVTSTAREDESAPFHLQWVFELLRAKCEAYSTLNESDDDPGVEERINTRMSSSGAHPPKAALITPAALYLTAILEALCEHILSDVGRVASRDSSRQHATVQDLFTGLCEDHAIYSLFKGMKVYDQIEQLSMQGKPRSSKSFTRNERAPPRTSSPHLDSTSSRSRLSSETPSATSTFVGSATLANTASRPSFEKSKALKMFKPTNRSSIDRDTDSQNGHKRSGSLSESLKQPATPASEAGSSNFEDELLQQQFDDLMRSSATMKVSLTPDRLKTMEAYKQEKDQRGNRNRRTGTQSSPKVDADTPPSVPPRASGRRPSLIRVDSIKEDEEDTQATTPPILLSRPRHSVDNTPTSPQQANGRARSISTSATQRPAIRALPQPPMPAPVLQPRRKDDANGFPPKTRKIQKKRESLDLDDVMGGSDNEDAAPKEKPMQKALGRVLRPGQPKVSAGTRELMDFLASGPPDMGGPPPHLSFPTPSISESTKSKGSGRLQKMISKLSLSNSEKSRGQPEDTPNKSRASPTSLQSRTPISTKSSLSNIYLANRPIPPRPPKPYSPPPSPTQEAPEKENFASARKRSASLQSPNKSIDHHGAEPPLPTISSPPGVPGHSSKAPASNGHAKPQPETASPIVPARKSSNPASPTPPESVSRRTSIRKPPPTYIPDIIKSPTNNSTEELRNLFFRATSADECRLILDMFLLKNGATIDMPKQIPPQHVQEPVVSQANSSSEDDDSALEANLVQFLLSDSSSRACDVSNAPTGSESSSEAFSSAQSSPAITQKETQSSPQSNGHANFPPGLENGEAQKEVEIGS